MVTQRHASCVLAAVLYFGASSLFAATVYEAPKIGLQAGEMNMEVAVVVSHDAVKADVSVGNQVRVSMIESQDRLILVDHTARIYVEHSLVDHPKLTHSMWTATSRKQFALGGYCRVVEMRLSDRLTQERCVVSAESVFGSEALLARGTHVGEFLAQVALSADTASLFDSSVAALSQSGTERDFPLIVRTLVRGDVTDEIRLRRTGRTVSDRNVFGVPSGFRHLANYERATIQAAR